MPSRPRRSGALQLFLSTHPGPSVAVAALSVILGITTLESWRIASVGLAVLLGQFSVGLSNDWLDADRDRAAGRADKPVAAGDVGRAMVRNTAIITGIAGLALTLMVGLAATAAHAIFMAAGWAYNLGLKKSAASVLPYLVGFGALPAVVTLAREFPAFPAWWAVGAGAALGVAAHFANVLPDLADDQMTGVAGLPHILGSRLSSIITLAALAAATTFVVFGPGTSIGLLELGTLVVEGAIVTAGVIFAVSRPPGQPLFRLVILGALVAVVSLALSGSQLAA